MARDLAEQEKAFIDALAADTGRDLDAWMSAIAASGHIARNDIIDWLRHQGFTFANASWLERIHHNGGRLIYAGTEARMERPIAIRPSSPIPTLPPEPIAAVATGPEPATAPADLADPIPSTAAEPVSVIAPILLQASPDAEILALLATAKGLRPLADYLLREIDIVVSATVRISAPPFITLASPMPFVALLPGPKEIRLYGDFGPKSRDRARKADSARVAAPFPDVIVLNDARQVDDRLRELVGMAYSRALK